MMRNAETRNGAAAPANPAEPPPESHDLRLPDWGPYSKTHAGISHIADHARGLRVDFIPVPGLFRKRAQVPSALWDSDVHIWDAAPDLSRYRARHELLWKDRFYADIDYTLIPANSPRASTGERSAGAAPQRSGVDPVASARGARIHVRFTNTSDRPLTGMLNLLIVLRYPNERTRDDRPLVPAVPLFPGGRDTPTAGLLYDAVTAATLGARMVVDALLPAEHRASGFVNGRALHLGVPAEPGGPRIRRVQFTLQLETELPDAELVLRYASAQASLRLEFSGIVETEPAVQEEVAHTRLSCGRLRPGSYTLTLSLPQALSEGPDMPEAFVDIIGLLPASEAADLSFPPQAMAHVPDLTRGEGGELRIAYPGLEQAYHVRWSKASGVVRELYNSEIDRFLPINANNHVDTVLRGDGQWHFTDLYLRPIAVEAEGTVDVYIDLLLEDAAQAALPDRRTDDTVPNPATQAEPAGESPYAFSQQLLRAALLTNVVFPITTRYGYIRHNTPGKWWDSLYTWDSGFIGLGLLEIDRHRADDCLRAYLTLPQETAPTARSPDAADPPDLPFLLHGTPLPVQIFVAREHWNRHHDLDFIRRIYPGLVRMYDYLAGRPPAEDRADAAAPTAALPTAPPTRPFDIPVVVTWSLFYNSGGWDDYPPQYYVHERGLQNQVAPVVSTAYLIRCAHILASFAELLDAGHNADTAADIAADQARFRAEAGAMAAALHSHAWDPASGYFGYMQFDRAGHPTGILRSDRGENFNMGLDGISPLVAGILDPAQRAAIFRHIEDPGRLWTDIGLSTVDQRASYFRSDGYWNGAVWMPHQWFIWKSCIDHGRFDLALRIARTALELWEREAQDSYNSYEHFIIASGRGAGWHQFGGLSAPVLSFHNALFTPGRITAGFDVRVDEATPLASADLSDSRSRSLTVRNESSGPRWLLIAGSGAGSGTQTASRREPARVRATAEADRRTTGLELTTLSPELYGLSLPGGFTGTLLLDAL